MLSLRACNCLLLLMLPLIRGQDFMFNPFSILTAGMRGLERATGFSPFSMVFGGGAPRGHHHDRDPLDFDAPIRNKHRNQLFLFPNLFENKFDSEQDDSDFDMDSVMVSSQNEDGFSSSKTFSSGGGVGESMVVVDRPRGGTHHHRTFRRFGSGGGAATTGRGGGWWKGPNVCVEKKEIEEGSEFNKAYSAKDKYKHSTDCHQTDTSITCTTRVRTNDIDKTYVVKRQCCHGFRRKRNGEPGCEEIDLKDLVQTLKDLGSIAFLESSEKTGTLEMLREGNFTIFCPTNEALGKLQENLQEPNEIVTVEANPEKVISELNVILLSQMVNGFYRSGDLDDNMVVPSSNGQTSIRFNRYFTPEKMITANCAPIVSNNNYARNGVVHLVDKILPLPTRTVADIIGSDAQFSILKGVLSTAGLVQALRNPDEKYTVFAPTDAAFSANPALLQRLQTGNLCVNNMLQNHILPSVVCSSAIPNFAKTLSMLDNYITLTRDQNDKLFVDGVQIVGRDIVGTNGVVHIIDGLLMPSQAMLLTEQLFFSGVTNFLDMIEKAGLRDVFNSFTNATFFVPTNAAIESLPSKVLQTVSESPEALKNLLLFHVATPDMSLQELEYQKLVQSASHNKTLRIGSRTLFSGFEKRQTVQCAKIVIPNSVFCGGTVHVIDQLLFPNEKNVIEALEKLEGFSKFLSLLKEAELDEILRHKKGPFTLLAPTDDAFALISERDINRVFEDRELVERLAKMHILSGAICCNDLDDDSLFRSKKVHSLEGASLHPYRNEDGFLYFGKSKVVSCNIASENGLVHIIDRVMQPEKSDFFGLPFSNVFSIF